MVGRASKSASTWELRPVNSITDSGDRNCNRLFWTNNDFGKVRSMWSIGKELGFSFLREEEFAINRLRSMENRDNRSNRMEFSVSKDEFA